jgi:Trk-type K+ transport system membrane component
MHISICNFAFVGTCLLPVIYLNLLSCGFPSMLLCIQENMYDTNTCDKSPLFVSLVPKVCFTLGLIWINYFVFHGYLQILESDELEPERY